MNSPNRGQPEILIGRADNESEIPEGTRIHKARDPDAPARVERLPVVIDDRAEIRRSQEIFEQGVTELYDQAMARIADGEWVFSEHVSALELRRERAIADLREMMLDTTLSAAARTKAAEQLIALGDATGEQFLFDLLQSGSPDLRLASLESLREWDVEVDFSKPDRCNLVLSLLSDPDERIVQAAARLCTYRSIRGTEAKLIELLEDGRLKNGAAIATELATVASTRRAVDALLPHVLKDDAEEFSQATGYVFRKLVQHPDTEVAGPVRRALYDYTLRFKKQRYDQVLVDHLAESADHNAVPVLEDILKNAPDTVSRTYAVEALARLQPERAIELLTEHVKREGARSDIIRLVRRHASEKDFDQVAPVVIQGLQESGKDIDTEIARLFLIELGDRGERFIKERLDKLSDHARMWVTWKLERMDLIAALNELHAAGVIESKPDVLIAKMQEPRDRGDEVEPLDTSDPDSLIAALAHDGIVTMFDAETGMIPCDHARLILQFAKASRTQFAPQWPVQLWHQQSDEDYDAPYTVQFVLHGRVFQTGAENYGDWYDVEAVVRLINFALETVGQSRRFITLDGNGQIASFVFADPHAFLPIAEKYRLPLSEDPSQAMREGIEFEKRVIEQMK